MNDLAARLDIKNPPVSWEAHRAAFELWKSAGKCRKLDWEISDCAVEVFGLPDGVLPDLHQTCEAIGANIDLMELADLWHFLIFHLNGSTGDNPSIWPLPEKLNSKLRPLFPLVVLVSGSEDALDAFKRKGVSEEIARTTLSYSGYFVRDYYRKRGIWGLAELGWLRNFVQANLLQMGRLSFMAAEYHWPFRAFRNRMDGRIVTLCESSERYRGDGLADGTNSIRDPNAWTPVLEIGRDTICGCPVSESGVAIREPVTLKASEWEQVLAPGDQMIEVHIAAENGKLSEGQCAESYRQAVSFFSGHYPQTRFAAFTCWSWLLDPGLAEILPAESNIVKFQRAFQLLPVVGDHRQAYDLVYGDSEIDISTAPRKTYLQRAIADYVAKGKMLRSAAGSIIWDEAISAATNE